MTATTEPTAPAEVGTYLDEVAAHLASLPWLSEDDRAELLDDLTQHLSEVAAEEGPSLALRLGPPAPYAEELLAAAGLEPPGAPVPDPPAGVWVRGALAAGWDSLRRTVAEAGDLRPAWWILRGYLAASVLGVVTGGRHGAGHPGFPIPDVFGSPILGVLTVAAAVKLSVRLGQQGRPARRWVARAIGAGLAVYGLVLLGNLGSGRTGVQWVETATPIGSGTCLVNGAGQTIENLYPYDTQGRMLDQVLLYDQTGRPLDNLCPDDYDDQGRPITTEYGRDETGAPVINVFPRRQWASSAPMEPTPGSFGVPTTTVVPRAAGPPAVVVPRLVTTTTTTTTPATTSPAAAAEPTTTVASSPPAGTGSGQ